MIKPEIPANEVERLDALLSYKILDSDYEKQFDDITRLASEICQAPISIITLLDENRQWFKSKVGLDVAQTSREDSFCGHAINRPDENFIIENALADERFHDNPLVLNGPEIRAYAGVPLVSTDGFAFGTLCVIDDKPRKLSAFQISALERLAAQTMKLLELHKANYKLAESHNQLAERYRELEQFSKVVSHDLKSPLNNISMITSMLKDDFKEGISEPALEMIGYIGTSAGELKTLIDGILEYYKFDTIDFSVREKIRLREFTQYLVGLLGSKADVSFILPPENTKLRSHKIALGQILYNLIANAIKYNDKPRGIIEIGMLDANDEHVIFVRDNGSGIAEENFGKIFEVFKTLGKTDRFAQKGTGMGLSTVQKLTQRLGGRISLESKLGEGSTFYIHLKK